ncbi:AAA family ATPase [Staphylococcus sp. SQ8-PEA]|uniref:AAA family ATPase n=1 Tax=Staphylococcus marylandisciuri TaxID=2981529 RepID=A0ABT2QPJ7_9STAP|nr:AAA family ATPase [Staphylococcus marylandisciuri]MCU5745880.1 AAA family ATPase [Staphylococcus marylandisciuri]
MKLKLNKLKIKDFAGITEKTFNFNGHDSKIYGANGTGKTTTATALQWLLFDKGLDGSTKSFNPVPVNSDNKEQYELIPTVEAEFSIDDNTLHLRKESRPKYTTNQKTNRKEYNRSRTKKQFINEEPVKVTDFKNRIKDLIDADVFKLITNPAAFNDLDWRKRRELLFDIADSIDDEDIIKSNDELSSLKDLLSEHDIETKKKIIGDKIKQINKEIQDIPTRINQEIEGLEKVEPVDQNKLDELEKEIETLKSKKIELENGGKEIELKNQLADKKAELKRLRDNHNAETDNKIHSLTNEFNAEQSTVLNYTSKIRGKQQEVEHEEKRRKVLLADYKSVDANYKELKEKQFEYTQNYRCVCCGQKLPDDEIDSMKQRALEKFNKDKSVELEALAERKDSMLKDGKKIKPIIEDINAEISKYQKLVEDANTKSEKIQRQIDELKANKTDVTATDEYKLIESEISQIEQDRQNIMLAIQIDIDIIDNQIAELQKQKSAYDEQLMLIKSNERTHQRITQLRLKEDALLDEKEKLSHQLHQLNLFTQLKIKALEENINDKFEMASFKLFNQLVNGEHEETCVTTYDGVEYGAGLNNAARINVGLDIINTLSKHYNVTAPIFIDNAESVTDIIDTDAQQIQLIVSENYKHLTMVDES